jgi:hypothetical protein
MKIKPKIYWILEKGMSEKQKVVNKNCLRVKSISVTDGVVDVLSDVINRSLSNVAR